MLRPQRRPKPKKIPDGRVLSFPKSGRTWLAFLYIFYAASRILGERADEYLIRHFEGEQFTMRPNSSPAFAELHSTQDENGQVPLIQFSHYFQPTAYFRLDVPVEKVRSDALVLLVRDPRDVAVSYYHHLIARAHRNGIHEDVDVSEFVRGDAAGIRTIVTYMNQVAERGEARHSRFQILYFEDMLAAPATVLRQMLTLAGAADVDEDAIRRAVDRASFENLKRMEVERRAIAGKPSERDTLRFRRGKRGTHTSELRAEDLDYIERVIAKHLSPRFGRYVTSIG